MKCVFCNVKGKGAKNKREDAKSILHMCYILSLVFREGAKRALHVCNVFSILPKEGSKGTLHVVMLPIYYLVTIIVSNN